MPCVTGTNAGQVQRPEQLAIDPAQRHADAEELGKLLQVMLVTGNDRRQAVHQRAGRGRGADVDLANPASGMQCRQRAVDANGLAGLDNTVVRVDAKQHPVRIANQLPQPFQLRLHASSELAVGLGQWQHIQLPACQAWLPRAEAGGPGTFP